MTDRPKTAEARFRVICLDSTSARLLLSEIFWAVTRDNGYFLGDYLAREGPVFHIDMGYRAEGGSDVNKPLRKIEDLADSLGIGVSVRRLS